MSVAGPTSYAIGVDFGTLSGAVYDELFAGYTGLHDYVGRGGNKAMRTLRAIQRRAAGAGAS